MARLRGKITGIMESWPLQLTIRDDEGHDHAISLEEDTAVVTRAGVVGPGELREGQRVEVEVADDTGGDGLTTDDIVLLE